MGSGALLVDPEFDLQTPAFGSYADLVQEQVQVFPESLNRSCPRSRPMGGPTAFTARLLSF
jgi:hypothetical protein